MTAMAPAVVLGGHANAVSVTRSLARLGVHVYALGGPSSEVRHSRYCGDFVDLGEGSRGAQRWLEWLSGGPRGAVLLPCSDEGLELIARNRKALLELGYRPFEANDEVALAMLDKEETYRRARALDVAVPATHLLRNADELDTALPAVEYPCALKPVSSHLFHERSGRREKLFLARDRDELRRLFLELAQARVDLLLTEVVPGGDDRLPSYYTFLDDGEPLFHFGTRKLRQFPTHFGHGCYRLSEWDAEVAAEGLRFLQGVGVQGLAMVEFKRDERDDRLVLIECNHRFTSATELVRLAGIDLARLTYLRLVDRPPAPSASFREAVYLWYPADDVRALHAYRKAGELGVGAWARSLLHRQRFPIFDAGDLMPTLAFHWELFVRMLSVTRRRLRGRPAP